MIDLPPPTYSQTIEAIAQCDIPRANVSIKYEDYLQSDEITISDLGKVSDEKMQCLKSVVHPFYILTIENEAQRAAFYDFSERADRPQRLADAREWLRSRGLLERVPAFDPKQGVEKFANVLEGACGMKRGSALMSRRTLTVAVRPDFFRHSNFQASAEKLGCLTNMFTVSNASDHSVRLVFIGNAASSDEPKASQ